MVFFDGREENSMGCKEISFKEALVGGASVEVVGVTLPKIKGCEIEHVALNVMMQSVNSDSKGLTCLGSTSTGSQDVSCCL